MGDNNDNLTASRLTKNSFAGLARYAITIPVLFFITPFILHRLGPERYGIWAIFSVMTAFADLSDLGIASGLIRYIAKFWAEGDKRSINSAASTILVVYLFTGGFVVISALLLRQIISVRVLNIPSVFIGDAVFVVMGAVIAFFISLILGIFGSLLQGVQRLDLWNTTLLVDTILNGIGAIVVLSLGYGLQELVICRVIVSLISGLLNLWFAYLVLPSLQCRLSHFNWATGQEIVSYSLNILVSKITSVARDPLNKLILLWVNSLAGVAIFDIAGRISGQVRGLFGAMLTPVCPAASGIQANGGDIAIRKLYRRTEMYLILFSLPIFGGLIAFAKPIIELWLGPGYAMTALTLQGLLISSLFTILATPAYAIMEGTGDARLNAMISVFSAILSIGLGVGLGIVFGFNGVLAGVCSSMLVSAGLTVFFFHRRKKITLGDSLQAIPFKVVLFDILLMAIAGVLVIYIGHFELLSLAVVGTAYILLCVLGTLLSGYISRENFRRFRSLFFQSS